MRCLCKVCVTWVWISKLISMSSFTLKLENTPPPHRLSTHPVKPVWHVHVKLLKSELGLHVALLLQGLASHGLCSVSQLGPAYITLHIHLYPLSPSTQYPPFSQGDDSHSFIFSSQFTPRAESEWIKVIAWFIVDPFCLHWSCSPSIGHAALRGSNSNAGSNWI